MTMRVPSLAMMMGLGLLMQGGVASVWAQQDILPDAQRTNGSATLEPVKAFHSTMTASTVRVGESQDDGHLGVIMSEDGYVLTKASECAAPDRMKITLPDGSALSARQVMRDDSLDLLLLKIDRTGLSPVAWAAPAELPMGQWLISLSGGSEDLRLGVVSAAQRAIPNSGTVLGVRMGVDDPDDGVLIEEVATDSPAAKAGIQAEDVVMMVAGKAVTRNAGVAKILEAYHPGDLVKIRYLRKGKEMEVEVRLASKSHVLMNWSGADFANHGTSIRTDNFPEVIQHDLALSPDDMGGAVYNLEGKAIGLNIARVDRVTNFTLPVELFLPKVEKWMKDDRAKRTSIR